MLLHFTVLRGVSGLEELPRDLVGLLASHLTDEVLSMFCFAIRASQTGSAPRITCSGSSESKVAAAATAVAEEQATRVVERREKLKVIATRVSARIVAETKAAAAIASAMAPAASAMTASIVAGSTVAASAVAVGDIEAVVSNVPAHELVKPAVLEPHPAPGPGPAMLQREETVGGAKDDTRCVLPVRDHGPSWLASAPDELTGTQWLVCRAPPAGGQGGF